MRAHDNDVPRVSFCRGTCTEEQQELIVQKVWRNGAIGGRKEIKTRSSYDTSFMIFSLLLNALLLTDNVTTVGRADRKAIRC